MTDQEIKNSISDKALRYGVPSDHSILYDDLPVAFKNDFEKIIAGRNFGYPIVKYGHPNGNWVIIGTQEICWQDDQLHFLPIGELTFFSVPESEHKRAKEIQPNPMIRKFEYETLTINTLDGRSFNIWLNKGADYYGFWHMIIRFLNWRKDNNTLQSN